MTAGGRRPAAGELFCLARARDLWALAFWAASRAGEDRTPTQVADELVARFETARAEVVVEEAVAKATETSPDTTPGTDA